LLTGHTEHEVATSRVGERRHIGKELLALLVSSPRYGLLELDRLALTDAILDHSLQIRFGKGVNGFVSKRHAFNRESAARTSADSRFEEKSNWV
jgi:hypothetical protein